MQIRMSQRMKALWTPWLILASIFTVGMAAFWVSSTPTNVNFPLVKGTKLTTSAFRLQQSGLSLILKFKKGGDAKRPEHGSHISSVAWRETGYLYYPSPGEPVKIRITKIDSKESVIFEALPGDACNQGSCRRTLIPYIDDGNSKRFTWPPTQGLLLPAGKSILQIDVMDVGERISGEQVTLAIDPPLDIKHISSGYLYELLAWFFFWPFYAFSLFVWAAVLLLIGSSSASE